MSYEAMIDQLVALEDDHEWLARAVRPLCEDDNEDNVLGLNTVTTEDTEVERFFTINEGGLEADEHGAPRWVVREESYPTWINNNNPYFTMSGDNPVIECEAVQNDRRDRNLYEVQAPNKQWYSAQRSTGKRQCRNKGTILRFILANSGNEELLRKGWKRFWKRVYAEKQDFLFGWQVKLIRAEFEKHGITAKSKAR